MEAHFEWIDTKNRLHIAKHGVGFQEASGIFSDPHLIVREGQVVDGEQRWHAIGYAGRLLLVVHTVQDDFDQTTIRLISARKAASPERKLYEEVH